MARQRRIVFLSCAAALVAALSGCSSNLPKTAPVQGKVLFKNGKPLANATIQFIPVSETDSFIANGTTDENGVFQLQTYFDSKHVKLDGAVPGRYKVVITPYPHGQRIARNFGSPSSTPLTVEVPETGAANLTLEVSTGF